jgi:hypothetical protein
MVFCRTRPCSFVEFVTRAPLTLGRGKQLLTPFAILTGAREVSDPTALMVAQIVISGAQRHMAW